MNRLSSAAAGLAVLASLGVSFAIPTTALAHVVCGNRVFPATLTMDDPGVGDEVSLPTIQYLPIPSNNGNPPGHSIDYGYEIDKRITRDLAVIVNGDYFTQQGTSQALHGWNNTTITLKNELPCSEANEFVMSVGVIREFSRTGSSQLRNAGAIDTISNTAPTLYAGKGLGDYDIGLFRPLAVTGEASYQISDSPSLSPNRWAYAASLQYSMPYLQQNVRDLGLPDFFTHLIPLVEVAYKAPEHGTPTGTIAPGFLYEGESWQVGAEALIPANRATRLTQGPGFIVQLHFFLDDLFPNSIGKPLFDTSLWGK